MTPTQAIAAAVTTLSETFRQPLTEAAARGYVMALDDLTPELVQVGMRRALRECRFMPTPMELRELAGVSGPRVLARQIADAWEAVCKAMRQHDYTTAVDFGPLVNAVIRNLGGWQAACAWTLPEIETWKRKEFERVYEAFANGDQSVLRGEPLAGAFPGPVQRIAIAGVMPVPQLAAPSTQVSDLVRKLADVHTLPPERAPKAEPSVSEAIAADVAADRKARAEANDARAAESVAKLRERVAAGASVEAAE